MATLNLTPDTLLSAAVAHTSESVYRTAVQWDQATPIARIALQWLRTALHGALSVPESNRWFTMYPNAIAEATASERELLQLADCAVELAQ
jgi:hypothetical protein